MTKLSETERVFLVEAIKNCLLEYEELIKEDRGFVSESPEMLESCLEILGETKNKR